MVARARNIVNSRKYKMTWELEFAVVSFAVKNFSGLFQVRLTSLEYADEPCTCRIHGVFEQS